MKKLDIGLVVICLFLTSFLAVNHALASDELIAAGGRLERHKKTTVAATGQAPVTISGREGFLMKLVRIIQKPGTENNTAALSLVTREGDTYALYSLAAAVHSQVRVDDLEGQKYYANGATSVVATATYPVYLRSGETLSVQGSTNSAALYVFEFVVVPN